MPHLSGGLTQHSTYYRETTLTIQATDSSDHFAILKDIPITLTTKQTNGASTSSGVLGSIDTDNE